MPVWACEEQSHSLIPERDSWPHRGYQIQDVREARSATGWKESARLDQSCCRAGLWRSQRRDNRLRCNLIDSLAGQECDSLAEFGSCDAEVWRPARINAPLDLTRGLLLSSEYVVGFQCRPESCRTICRPGPIFTFPPRCHQFRCAGLPSLREGLGANRANLLERDSYYGHSALPMTTVVKFLSIS